MPFPDQPYPTSGDDVFIGTDEDDILNAYIGHDLLQAGAGNDTLIANYGDHTLEGGIGDDSYFLQQGGSTYVIDDIGGNDEISFMPSFSGGAVTWYSGHATNGLYGLYRVDASGAESAAGNDLHLVFTTYKVTIRNYFVTGENGGHIESLRFADSNSWQMSDVLAALAQPQPSITNDFLYADATGLPTYLDGGAGNDYLHSYFANDTLVGGSGNDTLLGSSGDNVLKGGTGNDVYWLDSWGGQDVISDEGGIDTVNFTDIVSKFELQGLDLIVTGMHETKLTIKGYFAESASEPGSEPSGGPIEHLWVQGYEKEWEGYVGPHGYTYHDWTEAEIRAVAIVIDPSEPDPVTPPVTQPPASAQQNADSSALPVPDQKHPEPILASAPVARFLSSIGRDSFMGTNAADVFQFKSAKAAGLGKQSDQIVNFERGHDEIDLSGIDANTKVAGNNAFKALLTGKKPFTKAGQLHYDSKTGVLSGNTDKDAAAEFQIQFKNKPELLKLSDFIL